MTQTTETTLSEPTFRPLSIREIAPGGWLREQLEIQAAGLTGHIDEFWPDIAASGWIGGNEEGWERAPYWLDGLVPLAWQLDDAALKAKVEHWIEAILAGQGDDGWIGAIHDRLVGESRMRDSVRHPFNEIAYDPWPRFILLKVLVQYHDATGDPRIPTAIERFLQRLAALLDERVLRSWARMRWADLVVSIHWMFDRTGESWLLDLARTVHDQGYDPVSLFERYPFRNKLTGSECELSSHGPNNAMAIKAPGAWYRQSLDPADRAMSQTIIETLDRFHGQANGMFSCDEHLAGRSPSQGSELCAVVEYMYSLEVLLAGLGDVGFADRLELLTFNALPATISADMWTHQYDQQVNQVVCRVDPDRVYTSNGPDANLFGLEPHFGCCTANMHQGWPKYAASLWMRGVDESLVGISYAPCTVTTIVNGSPVRIEVESNYPFEDEVRISIHSEFAGQQVSLRIPEWATAASLSLNGVAQNQPGAGTFHDLRLDEAGDHEIVLDLNPEFRNQRRFNDSVSIYRGSLLYALPIEDEWHKVIDRDPVSDFEIHPRSPWNYALALDSGSLQVEVGNGSSGSFHDQAARLTVSMQGRRVPEWVIEHNAAGPVPSSPVDRSEPLEHLTLMPYGGTTLRIGEFPMTTS